MKKTMKVYTKTGDKGTTSLIGGKRVAKSDIHLEIYGTLDELSSFIGLLKCEYPDAETATNLDKIQKILTTINFVFACPDEETGSKFKFSVENIEWIENQIDTISTALPPIKDFLIPGSNKANAIANICRTVCRRAERNVYKMEMLDCQKDAAIFINRLSDYFFVLGRKAEIKY